MTAPRTPDDGAPLDADSAASPVKWPEAWDAAEREFAWADERRLRGVRLAAEIPNERKFWLDYARRQARRSAVFFTITRLIERASTDPEIMTRLREIATDERRACAAANDVENERDA